MQSILNLRRNQIHGINAPTETAGVVNLDGKLQTEEEQCIDAPSARTIYDEI